MLNLMCMLNQVLKSKHCKLYRLEVNWKIILALVERLRGCPFQKITRLVISRGLYIYLIILLCFCFAFFH